MRFNLEKSPVWTREPSKAIFGTRARSNVIVFLYDDTSVICFKSVSKNSAWKKLCSLFYGHTRMLIVLRHSSEMIARFLFNLLRTRARFLLPTQVLILISRKISTNFQNIFYVGNLIFFYCITSFNNV